MPRVMVAIQMTNEEKALLDKRAEHHGQTIGEYLRVCVLMDGVMDLDVDALKIAKHRAKAKVGERLSKLLGVDVTDALIKRTLA
jgi:hypothetical protein